MDLLVSYPWHHFHHARQEVARILTDFGDSDARLERTSVWGIAILHTCLDNRQVIGLCQQLFSRDPGAFQWTVKWRPVDYWCHADLETMKRLIEERIRDRIGPDQSWAMKVEKRRWQCYHTSDIVAYLAAAIDRKVRLDNPDWIVWVDVVGREAAISLLRPTEIFSLNLSHL